MTRILQIVLLPLLLVTLPLIYAVAWLHEAVSELIPDSDAAGRQARRIVTKIIS